MRAPAERMTAELEDVERELQWVESAWVVVALIGLLGFTWGPADDVHMLHPTAVLGFPFLLVGLVWLSRSVTGRARAALHLTAWIAGISGVVVIVGEHLTGETLNVVAVVGLLAFSRAMGFWTADHGAPDALQARWARSLRWSTAATVVLGATFVAWSVRNLAEGEWTEWDLSNGLWWLVVGVAPIVLMLGSLLSVARSTRRTDAWLVAHRTAAATAP